MISPVLRLKYYILILALVLITGFVGFQYLEGLSPLDSVYLTIVTISTVGYGDITAKTDAGKILGMFVILAGVGSFIFVIANSIELTLGRKEAMARQKKVNMIVGVFFSETGNPLIRQLKHAVTSNDVWYNSLQVQPDWTEKDFATTKTLLGDWDYEVRVQKIDLDEVHRLLRGSRTLLVQLLQHPVLFEHESFTDLLNAVFHLEEELSARDNFTQLPESDLDHLSGDTKRVLSLIILQWLDYMLHLKMNYPYLFSLAVRLNPFSHSCSPVVR